MDKCKKKHIFTLTSLFPHFNTKPIDINIVDAVFNNNRVDMLALSTIVQNFIRFFFELKVCLKKVFGKENVGEIYYSLDYMDEWIFDKHAFELYEHGDLKKLSHIEQPVAVRLASKHCSSTMIQIYSLLERIFNAQIQNHNDILIYYHMFNGELSPEVLVNISFYSNQFYQYFLQIPDGYFINHLLKRKVSHGKRYIFRELGNVSLRKIMDYCYTYTA